MFHRTLPCCKHPEVLSPKGPASEGFGKVSHLSQEDEWHSEAVVGGGGGGCWGGEDGAQAGEIYKKWGRHGPPRPALGKASVSQEY